MGRPGPPEESVATSNTAANRREPSAQPNTAVELGATILGYALLALGLTWPLALHLTERLPGNRPLDIWVYVWTLWWVRQALTALGTNPFETTWIFYPDGVPLYLHTLTPLPGLLALPIGWVWGTTAAYNATVLFGLTLAGVASYWLARRWTSPAGAAMAGIAFAAAPWVLHQLRIGHLNLMNCGWLPLALLLLLRASDTGRPRDGLLAVVGLTAAALVDWQFVLFLGLAGVVVLIERLLTAESLRQAAGRAAMLSAIALTFGLVMLPLALAISRQTETVAAADLTKFRAEQTLYAADLASYVVPQLLHPLWGRAVSAWLTEHPLGAPTEGRVGLALTTLALAGVAVAARRPGVWLWLGIGGSALLLSLGPRPHLGGIDLGQVGPFVVLADLPLVGLSRTPARFAVLVALAAAMLAGIGLDALTSHVRRHGTRRVALATTVAACLVLVFELWPAPFPSVAPPSSTLAAQVARLARDGAVLELPYLADDAPRLYYQTVHQRPITSGYITRQPPKTFLEQTPVIADLMWPPDAPDIIQTPDRLGLLNTFGIRAIVVYRPPYYRPDDDRPGPSEATMRRRVQALLRVDGPTWENETGAIYAVPVAPPTPVVALTTGWHAPEAAPDGAMRWLSAEGGLRLDRARPEPVTLRFTAHSFARPRALEFLADGQPLATLVIGTEPGEFSLPLPPGAGTTWLTLRSLDGADTPAALGRGADPRPLSVAISNLRVANDG